MFKLAVEQRKVPYPQAVPIPFDKVNGGSMDHNEDHYMRPRRYEETEVPEAQQYIRVPTWLIVLLSGILMALVGNFATAVWFAASIREELTSLKTTVEGQGSTSIQNQINEMRLEIKANEERENDTRLRLAGKGLLNK